jgi:hypothetical protein
MFEQVQLLIPEPIEKPAQLFQSFWASSIEASCPDAVHREQAGLDEQGKML